jgi:hypothetical protein
MRRPLALLAALPALALGLPACGGEDEPARLSAAEYRTQLDRVCRESDAAVQRLGEPQPTVAGLAQFVERGVAAVKPAVDRAAALRPPENLQATHDQFIANGRETLAAGPRLVRRIRSADDVQGAARAVSTSPEGRRLEELDRQSDQLAGRLGARACVDD